MECKVARRPSDEPFVVVTPQSQVRVVGTQFALTLTRGWTRKARPCGPRLRYVLWTAPSSA